MPSSLKQRKLAKSLLRLSTSEDGTVDQTRVIDILNSLRASKVSGLRSLLRCFLAEVRRHESSYHARVEIGSLNDERLSSSLRALLNGAYGKTINLSIIHNQALIAGYKLRIGDDVFEDSIQNRLHLLSKSFH